jgi:hypothetical protein
MKRALIAIILFLAFGLSLRAANSISGNTGQPGVTVVIAEFVSGGYLTTTSDGSGNYTFSNLGPAKYYLVCGLNGFWFAPAVQVQTIVSTNLTNVNFTATANSFGSGVWTKYGDVNLITPSVAWNSTITGTAPGTVILEGGAHLISPPASGQVFKAWNSDGANVYYSESADGVSWTENSTPSVAGVVNHSVAHIGSTYYLSGTVGVGPTSTAMYTSSDGITFTLANANAITVGAAGTWDSGLTFQLHIVGQLTPGTWTAIYTAGSYLSSHTKFVISLGLATSTDLINWTKDPNNPVFFGASSPAIVQVDGIYYAYYNGVPYDLSVGNAYAIYSPADLWRAQSTDLRTWTNARPVLLRSFIGEGRDMPDGALFNPTLVAGSNSVYMYYGASNFSQESQNFKFMLATANMGIRQLVQTNEGLLGSPQLAIDTFQRANENPLSGGGNWTNLGNNFQLLNKQASPTVLGSFSDATYSGVSWSANQYNEAVLGAQSGTTPQMDLIVRYNGSVDYDLLWQLAAGTSQTVTLNAAGSPIGTFTATPRLLDVWRLEANGTTINVYQNGTKMLTRTSSAVASGNPYIQARNGTANGQSGWSAWEGGNPTAAALPAIPFNTSVGATHPFSPFFAQLKEPGLVRIWYPPN